MCVCHAAATDGDSLLPIPFHSFETKEGRGREDKVREDEAFLPGSQSKKTNFRAGRCCSCGIASSVVVAAITAAFVDVQAVVYVPASLLTIDLFLASSSFPFLSLSLLKENG